MSYGETKVYFDGSHYIAIPHTTRPSKKRPKKVEELITVVDELEETQVKEGATSDTEDAPFLNDNIETNVTDEIEEIKDKQPVENKAVKSRTVTRKELFEELYKDSLNLPKYQRKSHILKKMTPYFESEDKASEFVTVNLERKQRNLICKRIRMTRKANLQEFNYFCTFTYDDKKHSEVSFKKKLKKTLENFSTRYSWKYMGVWERSPKKKRLHFHGIFYIPDTKPLGLEVQRRDYSFSKKDMITTYSYTYFEDLFGRADFEIIEDKTRMGNALAYLMKYLEKTGERIIYSKGLPQFFISDIMDDDIVCTFGQEDKKLLLFDDFSCWDEGCYMGQVSPTVIQQMRKAN